jgi:hypothetical protein
MYFFCKFKKTNKSGYEGESILLFSFFTLLAKIHDEEANITFIIVEQQDQLVFLVVMENPCP